MSASRIKVLLVAVLVLVLGAVALSSAPSGRYTLNHRASYATPQQAAFAGAGLAIKVTGAEIAADGTIRARVKLTDAAGRPIDREGIQTPGPVSVTLIAAYIPKGRSQYVAYTTRPQTSPITNVTAIQASGDSNGTFAKTGEGEYLYTFATKAANVDRGVTHTIGAYGSRNLSELDMGTFYSDGVYHFVPDGSKVTAVRDVVKTATCNGCHHDMAFHGGPRKSMEVCVLCHQPQSVDPDTGNTVDMPVMTHKIHMGSSLPSVKAGKPYVIIGNRQSVNDYSDINFPADARSCLMCHPQGQQGGAAQAENLFKPTQAACGACHDDVNFATGENHLNLPQFSDNLCVTCHIKQGEVDFDASVLGAHAIPTQSRMLGGVVLDIKDVAGNAPGKNLTVTFTVFDKAGKPLAPSQLSRLNFRLNGSSNDYKATISEDALKAQGNNGYYFWTFLAPLPANAKGTWTLSMEGRRDVKLLEGTKKEQAVRDTAANANYSFSVDGSNVQPRRTIVSTAKCNACHGAIAFHGGPRNTVENCPLCHTASLTAGTGSAAVSLDFPVMVHRIHAGRELSRPYKIGNTSFNDVGYPGDLRNCAACHVNGSENVPLMQGLSPVSDPAGPLKPLLPAAAACTGCHDATQAAQHIDANTTALGESCGVCHGKSSEFAVSKVHAN